MKPKTRLIEKLRLDALTDGVFAVAMTLLVFDLKFPEQFHPASTEEFLSGLSADSEPHRIQPATKDEGNDRPREKRGNPRRLSKRARATARALRRLRRP